MQYDIVNVIDLEATCWRDGPLASERREIIEVGIAELDAATGAIWKKTSNLVKPEQSEISSYCTELTGITPAQAVAGVSLDIACLRLRKEIAARERVCSSWGDFDRALFGRKCTDYGVPYPPRAGGALSPGAVQGGNHSTCVASDMEALMGHGVALWVYGHTHDVRDMAIRGTRVVCIQRGYAPHLLVKTFDE